MIWSFPPWKNSRRCDLKAPTFPTILARMVELSCYLEILKSWNQLLWNIYPRKDAGVIGVPDEDFGELPRAFVVKAPGSNVTGELVIILRAVFWVHLKKMTTSTRGGDLPRGGWQGGSLQAAQRRSCLFGGAWKQTFLFFWEKRFFRPFHDRWLASCSGKSSGNFRSFLRHFCSTSFIFFIDVS